MSDRLRPSRRRFERSIRELDAAVEAEFGWSPKLSRWSLPLIAGALGLILGAALRRKAPRLRGRR